MPKYQHLSWSIEKAATEFGINPRTLRARIHQAGIEPGPAQRFTTKQIVTAIYNDLESARIGLTLAQKEKFELENQKLRGEVVDVAEFSRRFAPMMIEMKRIVKSSKLLETEQNLILEQLARVLA